MRAPLIAVAGVLTEDATSTHLPQRYAEAVLDAGGLPVVAPAALGSADQVESLLDRVDGLLVPGGPDIAVDRLGLGPLHPAARPVSAQQHDWNAALLGGALRRRMPVLGICYGMQLLGCTTGGALHQHLPDDAPSSVRHFAEIHLGTVEHDVALEPGSRTAAAMGLSGGGRIAVVSAHHQAIASVGPGWVVSARAADGVVEAIEHGALPFAVGVQWHPDRAAGGVARTGLFAALVQAAAQRCAAPA